MSLIRESLPLILVPGAFLLGATTMPNALQHVFASLRIYVPSISILEEVVLKHSCAIQTAMWAIVVLNSVRWVNRYLTGLAQNSWRANTPDDWEWSKEIAVVTGGASGIGKAITQNLISKGITVAALDIQDPPAGFKDQPGVYFFKCDVSSQESVAAAAKSVREQVGNPSILFNNAGISIVNSILGISAEALQRTFSINSIAHWFTVQEFLPDMIQRNKGHVVTISSSAAFVTTAMLGDYSASKAAARSFHEALTIELKTLYKAPNVLTTVVHPEYVKTPMNEEYQASLTKASVVLLEVSEVADKIVARVMSKRGGDLVLPENHWFSGGIRAWPGWMQEMVREKFSPSFSKSSSH